MAVTKTAVDSIGLSGSKTAIAASASSTSSAHDVSTALAILVTASVDFGGTPDDDTQIDVLTSTDNSNFDTIPYATFAVSYLASNTVQKSVRVGPEVKYMKLKATNNDSADSVDVWVSFIKLESA